MKTDRLQSKKHSHATIIYGSLEQKKEIRQLSYLLAQAYCGGNFYSSFYSDKIWFVATAKSNHDYFKERKNTYSMEQVLNGEFRTLKRVCTAHLLKSYKTPTIILMQRYMQQIYEPIHQDLLELDELANKNRYHNNLDEEFLKEIMLVATEKNLIDAEILRKKARIEAYFADLSLLDFVNPLKDHYYGSTYPKPETFVPAVVEYLKFKKKRVNSSYYLVQPQPEAPEVGETTVEAVLEEVTATV